LFNVMNTVVRCILRIGMFSGNDDEIALDGERYELTGKAGCIARELTDLWHGRSPVFEGFGVGSMRGRPPFVAAVAFLIGPERERPADDGTGRKRSEVTAVEAVPDFPIHEEEF